MKKALGILALILFASMMTVGIAKAETMKGDVYLATGGWRPPAYYAYDGDWGSYSTNFYGSSGYLYMNYTIPADVNDSSYWEVEGYSAPFNIDNATIMATCDVSEGKLVFRAVSNYSFPPDFSGDFQCWTGSDWQNLYSDPSNNAIIEEQMCWYYNNDTQSCVKSENYVAGGLWADSSADKTYDNDWASFGQNLQGDGNTSYVFVNYTLPLGATSPMWHVKDSGAETTLDIGSCDIPDGKFVLRYGAVWGDNNTYYTFWDCYQGSDFANLRMDSTNNQLFEEEVQYTPKEPNGTLLGQWHFDENTGLTAYDNVDGVDLYGFQNGVPKLDWVQGISGSGASFDGTDSSYNYSTICLTDNGTISAWVNPIANSPDHLSGGAIIAGNTRSDGFMPYGIWYDSYTYADEVSCGVGDVEAPHIFLPQNAWTMVTCKWNTTGVYLYLNGTAVGSASPQLSYCSGDLISVGDFKDGVWARHFNGTIDEVSIGTAMTDEQIMDLFNEPTLPYTPPTTTTTTTIPTTTTTTIPTTTTVAPSGIVGALTQVGGGVGGLLDAIGLPTTTIIILLGFATVMGAVLIGMFKGVAKGD